MREPVEAKKGGDRRPLPPLLAPDVAVIGLSSLLAAPLLRHDIVFRFLRVALLCSLRRAYPSASRAASNHSWLERTSEARLRAPSLGHIAWTAVLDGDGEHVRRAAVLVVCAVALFLETEAESCPPRLGESCRDLFRTTLLPTVARFEIHRGKGRHVLVGVDGALFAVDVLDSGGHARSATDVATDLDACVRAARRTGVPILAISSASRIEAAGAWPEIARRNPAASELVLGALFSVFLDPEKPGDPDACGRLAQAGPADSRFYWHGMQLVVFANGRAAVIGNYVAGVEGEGALELCSRLGAAGGATHATLWPPGASTVRPVVFDLASSQTALLEPIKRRLAVDAGGIVRVPGLGRAAWEERGVSPEGAVTLALRLAIDAVVPDVDELLMMVNLPHYRRGFAIRASTRTEAQERALAGDLDAVVDAVAAHRAVVRAHKRMESADAALFSTLHAIPFMPRMARQLLAFLMYWLTLKIERLVPEEARGALAAPVLAVDSSLPPRNGLLAAGRFGFAAPPRMIWVHHTIDADETRFVLQLGDDRLALVDALRAALPVALCRVRDALASQPTKAASAADARSGSPTSRLAYSRLVGLRVALRRSLEDEAGQREMLPTLRDTT